MRRSWLLSRSTLHYHGSECGREVESAISRSFSQQKGKASVVYIASTREGSSFGSHSRLRKIELICHNVFCARC